MLWHSTGKTDMTTVKADMSAIVLPQLTDRKGPDKVNNDSLTVIDRVF